MDGMEGKEVIHSGEGLESTGSGVHSDGGRAVFHKDEDIEGNVLFHSDEGTEVRAGFYSDIGIEGKSGFHSDGAIKSNSDFYSDVWMEGRAGFHSLPKEMVLRVLSLLSLDQLRACAEVGAGGKWNSG